MSRHGLSPERPAPGSVLVPAEGAGTAGNTRNVLLFREPALQAVTSDGLPRCNRIKVPLFGHLSPSAITHAFELTGEQSWIKVPLGTIAQSLPDRASHAGSEHHATGTDPQAKDLLVPVATSTRSCVLRSVTTLAHDPRHPQCCSTAIGHRSGVASAEVLQDLSRPDLRALRCGQLLRAQPGRLLQVRREIRR